jgi:thiosulfate dehydrogenase (quinone) large subunit
MNKTTYFLLRLSIGASMFGHGLVRLPKLNTFSAGMIEHFKKSILPEAIVLPFSYLLPFAEFIIGLLLLIGLFTRQASIAGGLLMVVLIFGTTTIEGFDALPSQLIHAAFFAVLLQFAANNAWALDNVLLKK